MQTMCLLVHFNLRATCVQPVWHNGSLIKASFLLIKTPPLIDFILYCLMLRNCPLIWTIVVKDIDKLTTTNKMFTPNKVLTCYEPPDVTWACCNGLLKGNCQALLANTSVRIPRRRYREYFYGISCRLIFSSYPILLPSQTQWGATPCIHFASLYFSRSTHLIFARSPTDSTLAAIPSLSWESFKVYS